MVQVSAAPGRTSTGLRLQLRARPSGCPFQGLLSIIKADTVTLCPSTTSSKLYSVVKLSSHAAAAPFKLEGSG